MTRLLAILLLAAMPVFAQTATTTVAQGKRGATESNGIGNVSNNGGIVTIGQSGGVTTQTVTPNQTGPHTIPIQWSNTSDLPSRIWATRKQDGTIILYNVTCTRHSTVQAETICVPNKGISK